MSPVPVVFPSSRAQARQALQDFLPEVSQYAAQRNYDVPGHAHVSRLSPAVSARLITEEEIVAGVLAKVSFARSEKFIQEVCWRTYWKGWLEMRPAVWDSYRESLTREHPDEDRHRRAVEGRTGIECFDFWVRELQETGYLHNHARMWFASIWIFTLGLPWPRGADFFLRYLLDGDAASNTLSWRWVAGWQTPGKTYVARADNIRKFTNGRFFPESQLHEGEPHLEKIPPHPDPDPSGFLKAAGEEKQPPQGRCGFLLLGEDLSPESSPLVDWPMVSVAGGWNSELSRVYHFSPQVVAFRRLAMADAMERCRALWQLPGNNVHFLREENWTESVLEWIRREEVEHVVCLYPATGPWRETLENLRSFLPAGTKIAEVLRPWDRLFWPQATKGFFPFREKIPSLLKKLIAFD